MPFNIHIIYINFVAPEICIVRLHLKMYFPIACAFSTSLWLLPYWSSRPLGLFHSLLSRERVSSSFQVLGSPALEQYPRCNTGNHPDAVLTHEPRPFVTLSLQLVLLCPLCFNVVILFFLLHTGNASVITESNVHPTFDILVFLFLSKQLWSSFKPWPFIISGWRRLAAPVRPPGQLCLSIYVFKYMWLYYTVIF